MSRGGLELEDFGSPACESARRDADRLSAYDEGYATGRAEAEAAARAEAEATDARGEALRARIDELGFTFHEARAHVMQAVTPMLRAILEHGLPQVLHATLGARLEQEFAAMLERYGDAPLRLGVAPAEREQIAAELSGTTTLPLDIADDPGLEPGQLVLAAGRFEHEIDIAAFAARLTEILGSIEHINKDLLAHG